MYETRVGVFGVSGKMGSQVVTAVSRADGMTIVGGSDINEPREAIRNAQVIVDFTHPDAVMENILWCLERDLHMVIGTTGFTKERLDQVRAILEEHPKTGVLIASNFSIGANLMMRFAQIAAPYYPSVEIIELHHPQKVDAPSGTAQQTAQLIAAAREDAGVGKVPDATIHDELSCRGGEVEGIHVHSVRLQGLVAHQQVLFGAMGENLTIRHDSFARESFMPGVVAAIRYVLDHPGLTVGMTEVLGI